jgi:hypothetical protein
MSFAALLAFTGDKTAVAPGDTVRLTAHGMNQLDETLNNARLIISYPASYGPSLADDGFASGTCPDIAGGADNTCYQWWLGNVLPGSVYARGLTRTVSGGGLYTAYFFSNEVPDGLSVELFLTAK